MIEGNPLHYYAVQFCIHAYHSEVDVTVLRHAITHHGVACHVMSRHTISRHAVLRNTAS